MTVATIHWVAQLVAPDGRRAQIGQARPALELVEAMRRWTIPEGYALDIRPVAVVVDEVA